MHTSAPEKPELKLIQNLAYKPEHEIVKKSDLKTRTKPQKPEKPDLKIFKKNKNLF